MRKQFLFDSNVSSVVQYQSGSEEQKDLSELIP